MFNLQQRSENNYHIIESQYFGNVNWYKMLFSSSNTKIAQYEAYPKTSFRNRTIVAGSNGTIVLSVPLQKGRSQKSQTKDVRISYEQDWREQHRRTIVSCYGKSPFFEFYQDGIEALLRQKFDYLLDLNLATQTWVLKQLKYTMEITLSPEIETAFWNTIHDHRDQFKPNEFQNVQNPVRYVQVFEEKIGFQPNLSVIDLLSCMGPASKTLL